MDTHRQYRLRRSVLYMPGSNARALEKARTLPADALILDLEDAVAPDAKPAARQAVVQAIAAGGYGKRELVIRVNGAETPWGAEDIAAAAASGADAVLFPKVEDAGAFLNYVSALERHGAPHGLRFWAMIETPRAILEIERICAATVHPHVLVMGTEDLSKALRVDARPPRTALIPALSHCLIAARARCLDILDGVYTDLADAAGYAESCRQGKALGFDGKTLIHPGQIQTANEVFGVSAAEAAAAAEIIHAWEIAAAQGKGVAVVRGRMVEHLHVAEARRLLDLHAAIQGSKDA